MLQHTGQFWSRISYQRTMWQHCSIPHTQLSPADICPFPRLKLVLRGRRFCDATDVIKNATEELEKKAFTKWLPGMFPTSSQSEVYRCTTGVILKEMQPQCLYCPVFLRNEVFPGTSCSYRGWIQINCGHQGTWP